MFLNLKIGSNLLGRFVFCFVFTTICALDLSAQNNIGSGNMLTFDGTNDRVNLGASFNSLSLPVTVMAWVKPSAANTVLPVFSSSTDPNDWHGLWVHVRNNQIQAAIADGSGGFAPSGRRTKVCPVPTSLINRWWHVTAVIKGANDMDLYLNGRLLSGSYNGGATSMVNATNGPAYIGYHRRNGDTYYAGDMDEVQIYDRALNTTEIRAKMCTIIDTNSVGLIGAWSFNDATSGANLIDLSSNNNSGTKSGGISHVTSSAPVGDRSFWTYSPGISVLGLSLNQDSVNVSLNGSGLEGIHIYFVDQLPNVLPSGNLGVGVNNYLGVFTVDHQRDFDLNYLPAAPNNLPNTARLARRDHNAASPWSNLPPLNTPSINLQNRSSQEQYILLNDCPPVDVFPPDTSICDSIVLNLPAGFSNINWSNGSSGNSATFYSSGVIWFTGILNNCPVTDTLVANIFNTSGISFLPNDTAVCDSAVFSLPTTLSNIIWSNNTTGNVAVFRSNGLAWFTATLNDCPVSDTVMVQLIDPSNVEILPSDTVLCNANSITLDVYNQNINSYLWSNGATTPNVTLFNSGLYWVRVFFNGGCTIRDSINIVFSEDIEPISNDVFSICSGQDSLTLNLDPNQFTSVVWSNGQTGFSATFTNAGLFWLSAEKPDGCIERDTFLIEDLSRSGSLQIFKDTVFCIRTGVTLSSPDSLFIVWPNGSNTTYYVNSPQTISYQVSDGCRDTTHSFTLDPTNCECDVVMPNAFTPNNDGLNDIFKPTADCEFIDYRLRILNRWGAEIFYTETPGEGFNGELNGEPLPSGVFVYKFIYSNGRVQGRRSGTFTLIR